MNQFLENLNNGLLMLVIVLLLLTLIKNSLEGFTADRCVASATGVRNVAGCTGLNNGQVIVSTNNRRYRCGPTDGYGFPCL